MPDDPRTMFGYPVRLLVELPDGGLHDITRCIEQTAEGWHIYPDAFLAETEMETAVRARIRQRLAGHA